MTAQGEPVDVVYSGFSKALVSVGQEVGGSGDPPQENPLSGGVPTEHSD